MKIRNMIFWFNFFMEVKNDKLDFPDEDFLKK